MKRFGKALLAASLIFFLISCETSINPVEPVIFPSKDNGTPVPFNETISAVDLVKEMQGGWNLGNTLDATGADETSWGQVKTTKAIIDGIKASGMKTIRIPVTYHNHIRNISDYTLDSSWLKRIKEIVDWAIEDGLYVIINCHHDNANISSSSMAAGSGYYPLKKDLHESEKFLTSVWAQVAATFNNSYDEHLIFETLNEPRLQGDEHEWWFVDTCSKCQEAMECLNEYNQLILDTIRASGGNNAKKIRCSSVNFSFT